MDISMNYPEGIMDLPIYSATNALVKGGSLIWGVEGSTLGTRALITSGDIAENTFAILQETPTTQTTNVATPIVYQAKVRLVGNPNIVKIYYDMATGTDLSVDSSTATVVTTAAHDDDLMDGGWIYINSGTGAGQLRYIKASDGTDYTVNTAFTTTPDATSDFILIRCPGLQPANMGIALNATRDMILSVLNETHTSLIVPLKNFIQGPSGTKELDITINSDLEMDGLDSRGLRFYALCVILDGIYATGI